MRRKKKLEEKERSAVIRAVYNRGDKQQRRGKKKTKERLEKERVVSEDKVEEQ